MKVRDVMTRNPICCLPTDSAMEAARIMKSRDVGAVPIVADRDSGRLIGIVTDRDLCKAIVAEGDSPQFTLVEKVMRRNPFTCGPEDSVESCERLMQKHQVRRIPVVDKNGRCIGIVAQADVALHAPPAQVAKTLVAVSKPSRRRPARRAVAA